MIDSVTKNQLDYHEAQQLTLSSDLNTITHMYVCPKGAMSYNKDAFLYMFVAALFTILPR